MTEEQKMFEFEKWFLNFDTSKEDLNKYIDSETGESKYFLTTTKMLYSKFKDDLNCSKLVEPEEIVHQQQMCENSCLATCIAMATGESVFDVVNLLKSWGHSLPLRDAAAFAYLVKKDILPVKIDNLVSTNLANGTIYICNLASNHILHSILVVPLLEFDRIDIYDPRKPEKEVLTNFTLPFNPVSVEALYDCSSWEVKH